MNEYKSKVLNIHTHWLFFQDKIIWVKNWIIASPIYIILSQKIYWIGILWKAFQNFFWGV